MQFRSIQGQAVSALGLGTLTWGRDTDDFEAREQIEVFLEAGGSFFDTSENFGSNAFGILREGLASKQRKNIQIAVHLEAHQNRRAFLNKINQTVENLGLDYLDYLVIEPLMSFEDWRSIANELIGLYETKVIDAVMFRNVPAWKSVRLQSALPEHLYAGEHFNYSLIESQHQDRLDQVQSVERKIIASSALASGVLTGKYRSTIPADSRAASPHLKHTTQNYLTTKNMAIVEAAEKAAGGLGVSTVTIALAWLRQQEIVASAIVGPRTVAQLKSILNEIDFELPNAIIDALNDVRLLNQA